MAVEWIAISQPPLRSKSNAVRRAQSGPLVDLFPVDNPLVFNAQISTMSPRIRLQPLRSPRAGPCPLQSHPEQGHVCSDWPPPCQGELCPLGTPRTWSYLLRIPKVTMFFQSPQTS